MAETKAIKIPAPRNKPTSNLKDEWGYFVIYGDGSMAFEKANIPDKVKIRALKDFYLIEVYET